MPFLPAHTQKSLLGTALVGLCLVLLCSPCFAHPHAFADYRLTFVFDGEGLEGFRVRAAFDPMFSFIVLDELNPEIIDEARTDFTQAELDELELEFKDFDYFTHVLVNGEAFTVGSVEAFSAQVDREERLLYSFFVPCRVRAEPRPRQVLVSFHDESYYREMNLMEDGIRVEGAQDFDVDRRPTEIEAFTFRYQGLKLVPEGAALSFRQRER